jgi:hypothetical protein
VCARTMAPCPCPTHPCLSVGDGSSGPPSPPGSAARVPKGLYDKFLAGLRTWDFLRGDPVLVAVVAREVSSSPPPLRYSFSDWDCVGRCGAVWGGVGLCGTLYDCVGLCGTVWDCDSLIQVGVCTHPPTDPAVCDRLCVFCVVCVGGGGETQVTQQHLRRHARGTDTAPSRKRRQSTREARNSVSLLAKVLGLQRPDAQELARRRQAEGRIPPPGMRSVPVRGPRRM